MGEGNIVIQSVQMKVAIQKHYTHAHNVIFAVKKITSIHVGYIRAHPRTLTHTQTHAGFHPVYMVDET